MEIRTVQIRHLIHNGFTDNYAEGDCHRKMLPYLWAVSVIGVILGAVLYF